MDLPCGVRMNERRIQRSEVPERAAQLYLEAVLRRAGCAGLTLADPDGALVASVGDGPAEAFAAVAPHAHATPDQAEDGLLGLMTRGRRLHVDAIEVQGEAWYFTALGVPAPRRVGRDLERILS